MILFFTSGTVSYPKMVLHPQSYGLGHVSTARFWHDLRPGDRHWTVTDTGWAKAAWGGLFGQWHERATIVQVALGQARRRHDPLDHRATPASRRSARRRRCTGCSSRPTWRATTSPRLRHCTSAGEPLNPEVIRAWKEGTGGLTVYDGYGQSETTVLVANYRAVPVRPGSMGKPVPGWTVEVLDEDGAPRAGRRRRQRSPSRSPSRGPVGLFDGYHRDDEANAAPFRDGWYFTGDKAWRDGDGYFWFEGRDDDVITSSAYRIGPFEVESALVEHPAVAEAAVVGKDDPSAPRSSPPSWSSPPATRRSDELAAELQEHTKSLTAPYKYPREIHFVDELPKTVSGKIRRVELREQLRSGAVG